MFFLRAQTLPQIPPRPPPPPLPMFEADSQIFALVPRGFRLQTFLARLWRGPWGDPRRRGVPAKPPLPRPLQTPPSPASNTSMASACPQGLRQVKPALPSCCCATPFQWSPKPPDHALMQRKPPSTPLNPPPPLSLTVGLKGASLMLSDFREPPPSPRRTGQEGLGAAAHCLLHAMRLCDACVLSCDVCPMFFI